MNVQNKKKSIEAKKQIHRHSKDFNNTLLDVDFMKLTGPSRNIFYKYKRGLKVEQGLFRQDS